MTRLPQTGSDDGTWGGILNDFLSVVHNADGTIKTGVVDETQLSTAVQAKLNGGGVSGVSSVNSRGGAVTLTKNDVGLANADNTSDANKPVSTATQTALNLKANTSSLSIVATTGAYSDLSGKPTIPAAQVNSDWNAVSGSAQILNKPTVPAAQVSSDWNASSGVTQILNKPTIPAQFAPVAGANISLGGTYPNITISASGAGGGGATDITVSRTATTVVVESSSGLDGTIAVADGTNAGILTSADKTKLDGIASGAQVNTVTSVATRTGAVTLTKSDVGLTNVDNTADTAKTFAGSQITSGTVPIGQIPTGTSGTTVALGNHTHSGFEATVTGGTTSQYYRGDKSWQTLDKTAAGLANVDNTSDATKNSASVTLTNKTISGASNTLSAIPESAVTNLTTDLAAKGNGLTPTAVKTSAYTATANQFVPVDTTGGAITITLPTAPADGTRIAVKHVIQGGTNSVTVSRGGSSDVFNKTGGSTSLTLSLANQSATMQYSTTGAIWYVQSGDLPLSVLDTRYLQASAAGSQVAVYNAYADAPALPANTVVVSITGS